MVEYLYDCIRANAGQDIMVGARITDMFKQPITEGCGFRLYDENEKMLVRVDGSFNGDYWTFTIPAEYTAGRKGRHWYCICWNGMLLCFKCPIYLK